MSSLMVNDTLSFKELKELLDLTDGNLATHMRALETAGYVEAVKSFVGRKPLTSYHITQEGKNAFMEHLDALEQFIRSKE